MIYDDGLSVLRCIIDGKGIRADLLLQIAALRARIFLIAAIEKHVGSGVDASDHVSNTFYTVTSSCDLVPSGPISVLVGVDISFAAKVSPTRAVRERLARLTGVSFCDA
jgi:hypothetical protein